MRILSVHSNYRIRGGEDESRAAEELLLQRMGHQINRYEENNQRMETLHPLNAATRTIWSTEAYQILQDKLINNPCDLIHVQNFFPIISPSIYYAAKTQKTPIVQTLRNYRYSVRMHYFFEMEKSAKTVWER